MMEVDEFASCIRSTVNQLQNVKVSGEIGRVTKSSSGHVYFDVSGFQSRINCVVWASNAKTSDIVSGMAELTVQKVDFYAPFGKCQAIVTHVKSLDESAQRAEEHARLIQTLTTEGILHRTKKTIPDFLTHICIITSDESAAYHDMVHSLNQRWPGLRTTIVHSSVQGASALLELPRAFSLAASVSPDVIVCGRGGGSDADLDAFNQESVVRCFVHPTIPIVSAIGHESDNCICDLVADVRAKTPTAAIEVCLPISYEDRICHLRLLKEEASLLMGQKLDQLEKQCSSWKQQLKVRIDDMFEKQHQVIRHVKDTSRVCMDHLFKKHTKSLSYAHTQLEQLMTACLGRQKQSMQFRFKTLEHILTSFFTAQKHKIEMMKSQLHSYSCFHTLQKGYCVLLDTKRRKIQSVSELVPGETMCVVMHDGKINVTVNDIETR